MRVWPETVSGEIAAAVMALPGKLEWSQVAPPPSHDKTVVGLTRKKNELRAHFLASGVALTEQPRCWTCWRTESTCCSQRRRNRFCAGARMWSSTL